MYWCVGIKADDVDDRTSGGKGGPVVHVSTFEALQAAVSGSAPKIVVVSGRIAKEGRITVGSNKSIIGKDGNTCECSRRTRDGQLTAVRCSAPGCRAVHQGPKKHHHPQPEDI